ncbi:unnamed protein product [Mycena citricolor]|uniref:Uncharacterized protein n=1 Tax=Mycena citricolor TaxID=2018698 RepID=A0AAD2GRZ8_9AGAR|nr:unnamed protein product [Mycena citricolor]
MELAARDSSAIDFKNSKWIWTPPTTNLNAALRKVFSPPRGRSLIAAEIILAANTDFQLFVNGDFVGSGTPPSRLRFAPRYCVDLDPSYNVFAVNATTITNSGALIATILVTYQDFSKSLLITDPSWRVSPTFPAGWAAPEFDDTVWTTASVLGAYGAQPWAEVNIASTPPVLTFDRGNWIWTNAVPSNGLLPAGQRAFRRTFTPAPNQRPASVDVIITADDRYSLWVNGVLVGNGTDHRTAQHWVVQFANPPPKVVFAVLATNVGANTAAGVIIEAVVSMVPTGRANCTASAWVTSDQTWVSTLDTIGQGWEQPNYDDSTWPAAVNEVAYPGAPWNTVVIAAAATPTVI